MKNTLLIVVNELQFNKSYYDYIVRVYEQKVQKIDKISFVKNSDKNLFLIIQSSILKNKNLLIITNQISYKTVSKIVSTITDANLIYEDNALIPSNAVETSFNSYLVEYKNCFINILKIEILKSLPRILLENKQIVSLYIFDEDLEEIKNLLKPIAESFNVIFLLNQILDGVIFIKASSLNKKSLNEFIKSVKKLYQSVILNDDLINFAVSVLKAKNLKISTAESCTGGLIASKITQISGASEIFEAGFITYSNDMKSKILGVNEDVITFNGAVSGEVVELMVKGALNMSNSDIAIAVSGVAGPNGGSKYKPVGTVYIAVGDKKSVVVKRLNLDGDREYIQQQTVLHCFVLLIKIMWAR